MGMRLCSMLVEIKGGRVVPRPLLARLKEQLPLLVVRQPI